MKKVLNFLLKFAAYTASIFLFLISLGAFSTGSVFAGFLLLFLAIYNTPIVWSKEKIVTKNKYPAWAKAIAVFVLMFISFNFISSSSSKKDSAGVAGESESSKSLTQEEIDKNKADEESQKQKNEELKARAKVEEEANRKAEQEAEEKRKAEEEAAKARAEQEAKLAKEELIKNAKPLPDYRIVKRDADELVGQYFKFKAKIVQVMVGGSGENKITIIRADVDYNEYIPSDTVYMTFYGKADVLEDQIHEFIAIGSGNYTYTSQANYQITLPSFIIERIK